MQGNLILQYPLPDFISLIETTVRNVLKENNIESDQVLNGEDVEKLFKISRVTLFNWRSSGKIPFVKHGNKILYNKAEILKAINNK